MQEILKRYNIKAKKSLWQNFLMDESKLFDIINSTNITWENILEVGPWFWALTEKLLEKSPLSLHLVELDNFMIDILNDRINKKELKIWECDFKIENIDILKYTPSFSDYKVIANIPYYITSPILFRFLYELDIKPSIMIILMQKEVWLKICEIWKNSKIKSSILSLAIQKKCNTSIISNVWKECFYPVPKVDSIVIKFEFHNKYENIDDKKFLNLIKASFLSPRKKLSKNLISSWYDKQKIDDLFLKFNYSQNLRAEDLSIDDYIRMLDYL